MSEHRDATALTRGASRGFTVLLLGGAVQPLVGLVARPVGFVWLVVVALVAFGWAATIAARPSGSTVGQGVAAAVGSYLLVLPVVFMATGSLMLLQVALTALTAVAVGALAAWATRRSVPVSCDR